MLLLNLAEFALHLFRAAKPFQHGPGLIRVSLFREPSRAIGSEQQSDSKCCRRNHRQRKHPTPRLGPGQGVVDEIGDDNTARERDLIDRNELSTDVDRGNLGNVQRCGKRSDADSGASDDPAGNQPCHARR